MSSASSSARDWKIWVLGAVSALCALLTAFNVFMLSAEIRDLQTNVTTRQQFIQESIPLARMNDQIIQTLANMSARSNDVAIRDMLARHGVTFSEVEADVPVEEQGQ